MLEERNDIYSPHPPFSKQGYNKGTRVLTTFPPLFIYGNFSRHSRTANLADPGWILLNFEFSNPMMLHMKFDINRPTGLIDIHV